MIHLLAEETGLRKRVFSVWTEKTVIQPSAKHSATTGCDVSLTIIGLERSRNILRDRACRVRAAPRQMGRPLREHEGGGSTRLFVPVVGERFGLLERNREGRIFVFSKIRMSSTPSDVTALSRMRRRAECFSASVSFRPPWRFMMTDFAACSGNVVSVHRLWRLRRNGKQSALLTGVLTQREHQIPSGRKLMMWESDQ